MVAAPFLAANGAVYSDGKVKKELRDLLHQAAKEDADEFATRQFGTVTIPEVVRLDEEVRTCSNDSCHTTPYLYAVCGPSLLTLPLRADRPMSQSATRPMLLRASALPPTRCELALFQLATPCSLD